MSLPTAEAFLKVNFMQIEIDMYESQKLGIKHTKEWHIMVQSRRENKHVILCVCKRSLPSFSFIVFLKLILLWACVLPVTC